MRIQPFMIVWLFLGLTQPGKVLITLNEEQIVLISVRGQVHAIQAKCPHQGKYMLHLEQLP